MTTAPTKTPEEIVEEAIRGWAPSLRNVVLSDLDVRNLAVRIIQAQQAKHEKSK